MLPNITKLCFRHKLVIIQTEIEVKYTFLVLFTFLSITNNFSILKIEEIGVIRKLISCLLVVYMETDSGN